MIRESDIFSTIDEEEETQFSVNECDEDFKLNFVIDNGDEAVCGSLSFVEVKRLNRALEHWLVDADRLRRRRESLAMMIEEYGIEEVEHGLDRFRKSSGK